jgi:uncharacterized protein (DUF1697 family)
MGIFVALLKGINVSGQKIIKMSDLKNLIEDLSFKKVKTFIQSGNVIFFSNTNNKRTIQNKIEKRIKDHFGFQVQVIIKTPDQISDALKHNPFLKDKKKDIGQIYFTFISENPSAANIKKLREVNYSPEEYILDDDIIYVFFPNGYGKSKMNNNFFEKKLNVFATTRNYKTVKTL